MGDPSESINQHLFLWILGHSTMQLIILEMETINLRFEDRFDGASNFLS